MRKKSKFSNGTELTNIDEIHMRIFDNFEQLLFCLDKAIFQEFFQEQSSYQ